MSLHILAYNLKRAMPIFGVQTLMRAMCVFRAKLDSDSAANWTPVPRQTGQAFQGKLDTLKEL